MQYKELLQLLFMFIVFKTSVNKMAIRINIIEFFNRLKKLFELDQNVLTQTYFGSIEGQVE